jgi:hypothetical protein
MLNFVRGHSRLFILIPTKVPVIEPFILHTLIGEDDIPLVTNVH